MVTDTLERPAAVPAAVLKAEVRNLNFYYGDFKAIKGVSMGIEEHKVTALIGPSGCGKSTLLRCFNRNRHGVPEAQSVPEVDLRQRGLRAAPARSEQCRRPRWTTAWSGAEGRCALGRGEGQARPRGLCLSGGQQQRLCIARGIAEARGAAARRALLGAGPDLHRQDRRADPRAQERVHGR
jgi:ATPase subunit of ABC transporter with duplicated ATPase domains